MIELKEAQRKAIEQMKNGCILCGGVGSGKTRTALAYYYVRMGGNLSYSDYIPMDDVEIKDLYVITTATNRDKKTWEKEMQPFLLTPYEECKVYDHKVVVDSWNNIQKYKDVKGAFFIFDEDHVTGKGKWVKAFLKIVKENEWIILSATPGDKYEDYIPVFIANGFYKNRTEFEEHHLVKGWNNAGKFPIVKAYLNTRKLDRLRDSLLVDIDIKRHTVSHHDDIWCDFDRELYRDICRNRWNPWEDKPIENVSEFCSCLRRVCNQDESRQVKVLELLEKHPKAIIFYNFDYELEILRKLLEGNGIQYSEWNGHLHQDIPEGDKWVYLVQYNAAEAWNCIKTDTIIFWSQTYSYRILVQACGRIDRMDTLYEDLYYYHLKSRAGLDLAIAKALKNKKKFNEKRFVGG